MKFFNYPKDIKNYSSIKDRLFIRFTNPEQIKTDDAVTMDYMDFKMQLYLMMESNDNVIKSFSIVTDMLDEWGISKEEAFVQAKENMTTMFDYDFVLIKDMLKSVITEDDEYYKEVFDEEYNPLCYVLTNDVKAYGAASLVSDNMLNDIYDKIGQDCYILPSSVHETIIAPKEFVNSEDDLMKIVKDVNFNQLEPEELLSNEVFYYNHAEQTIMSVNTGKKEKTFDEYLKFTDSKEVEIQKEDKTPDEKSPKF